MQGAQRGVRLVGEDGGAAFGEPGGAGPSGGGEIWCHFRRTRRVLERTAVAGVEVGFGGQALGEEEVVAVEFHVPVGDAGVGFLGDRDVVDQVTDRNEFSGDEDRVVGREDEVA